MSPRAIIVIVLALVSGGSAAFGIKQLAGSRRVVEEKVETRPVVVAKVDVTRGHMLTEDLLEVRPWPTGLCPPTTFEKTEDCIERAVLSPLVAGEPVLAGKVADKNSGRGLAALIPPGMRAYTIQTSRVASSVAGFILPGNRVDVLLTLRGGDAKETGGGSTVTLLQAVEILAVNQNLDAPAENKHTPKSSSSVTLLISPDQATVLDLGQNMGTLTLSLRNPVDITEAETSPATLNLLRYLQKEPLVPEETAIAVTTGEPAQFVSTAEAEPISEEAKPQEFTYQIRTLRGSYAGRIPVTVRQ